MVYSCLDGETPPDKVGWEVETNVEPLYQNSLTDLKELFVHAPRAEVVTWRGREAVRLIDGLAIMPDLEITDASVEVHIGAQGAAYPGIAFRVSDVLNFELGYAVPHVSGQWDALQYDPVFRGSNTWQLYHGPAYHKEARVPMDEWFRLRVDIKGDLAAFSVDDQPPLVVRGLAHEPREGSVGIWSFRPAYFSGFTVSECRDWPVSEGFDPVVPEGIVDQWFIEGFGTVECEPNGVLNLNRYLPRSIEEVLLTREFEVLSSDEALELAFGFSDELTLELDHDVIFTGKNTFVGFGSREERGYTEAGMHSVSRSVSRGMHSLSARLGVTEAFGWGMILAVLGGDLRLLPAGVG